MGTHGNVLGGNRRPQEWRYALDLTINVANWDFGRPGRIFLQHPTTGKRDPFGHLLVCYGFTDIELRGKVLPPPHYLLGSPTLSRFWDDCGQPEPLFYEAAWMNDWYEGSVENRQQGLVNCFAKAGINLVFV